ncbi:hypothetical protein [Streptomyces sp. SD15]
MRAPAQKDVHQHGWSPDADGTRRQDDLGAHHAFHPYQYAPDKDPRCKVSDQDAGNPHGRPVEERESQRRRAEQARQ